MQEINKYIVVLPQKLSTNDIYSSPHWRIRKKHKDLYRDFLVPLLKQVEPPKTPCHVTFNFEFSGRPLDVDNCSYMTKLMIDSFIAAGIIADDNPKVIKAITMRSKKGDTDQVEFYFQ